MAEIIIQNRNNLKVVTQTTRPLLFLMQEHFVDWMHLCGGKGRCTTCKVVFLEGLSNIGALTGAEKKYRALGSLKENERLACQVTINGNVTILVPESGKLPHIQYSDDPKEGT